MNVPKNSAISSPVSAGTYGNTAPRAVPPETVSVAIYITSFSYKMKLRRLTGAGQCGR